METLHHGNAPARLSPGCYIQSITCLCRRASRLSGIICRASAALPPSRPTCALRSPPNTEKGVYLQFPSTIPIRATIIPNKCASN